MSRFQTWYHALPKATRRLLTINVVVYVLWVFLLAYIDFTRDFFFDHLAFHTAWPGFLVEPWQFVTYNFLHLGSSQNPGLSLDSLLHIGFNMYLFYWFGREHEDLYGAKQLVAIYLITGIGGGLVSALLYAMLPASVLGSAEAVIFGASASVFGLVAVMVTINPRRKIHLLFIGSVSLLLILVVLLAIDVIFRRGAGVAVTAHLGGALFGFLFVKIEDQGVDLTSWARIFFRERPRRKARPPEQGGSLLSRIEARLSSRQTEKEHTASRGASTKKTGKSPRAKIHTLHTTGKPPVALDNEVDRILDKISEQGMESLTEEEKRLLEEASRR